MKKFYLFLLFLLISHNNVSQAELSGKLSEKIENFTIKDFFQNTLKEFYTKIIKKAFPKANIVSS